MKTLKIVLALLTVGVLASCNEATTGDVARETNYPLFSVEGDNPLFIDLGTTFTDPGVDASENGVSIPVTTTVAGAYRGGTSVDGNLSDRYDLTYSATNKDGFSGSASRSVYVVETGDLVTSIEGLYKATIIRNGDLRATDVEYVLIWKNSDGTYELSCGFGAYYEIYVGYGLRYKSGGMQVTANNIVTNDFTFSTFANDGFGGAITVNEMTVDAVNKKINFDCDWALTGWNWAIELNQVQL